MAHFFSIMITENVSVLDSEPMLGEENKVDQEKTYPLNPNFTLRNALRTGNHDMFSFILDIGCPYFDTKGYDDTFEIILEDILKDSENLLTNKKDLYLQTLFSSSLFKKWVFDQYSKSGCRVSVETDIFELVAITKEASLVVIRVQNALKEDVESQVNYCQAAYYDPKCKEEILKRVMDKRLQRIE